MPDVISTIRGTLQPQLQSETWGFDPTRGVTYRCEYKGASQALMRTLAQNYVAQGIGVTLTYNQGDTATLEIDNSTPGGGGDGISDTIDTWQIVGNDMSYDLLMHPALINALAAVTPAIVVDDVIAAMRSNLHADTKETNAFSSGGDLYGAPEIVRRFYRLAIRGSDEYRRAQYVLRHTTNAPNRYAVNVADFGIEQIYTTAELLTECQDSALWAYPMPGRLAYKINAIVAPEPRDNYLWGWLKSPSTETTAANNRIDIVTEYTLELWSTDVYAPF